jgi:acyl-CoA thioesterase II
MSTQNAPSIIEKQVNVVCISDNPGVFTNISSLWRPGAHGIFGGFAIAQSLSAAQQTVSGDFIASSLHGSFVYAGNSKDPVFYHVERIRDGKGFCTRSVRALQRGRPIFICNVSFAKKRSPGNGEENIQHGCPIPPNIPIPENDMHTFRDETTPPFINRSVGVLNKNGQRRPEDKCFHQWIKASNPLSLSASFQVHQAALAFMSDSYFLAGVPHSHEIWHFVDPPISEFHPSSKGLSTSTEKHTEIRRPHLETPEDKAENEEPRVSMMVSLDHTIYFHNMENFRADDWLLSEIQSSWAGNGRGLVQQRMWTRNGDLVATCIQEVSTTRIPYPLPLYNFAFVNFS